MDDFELEPAGSDDWDSECDCNWCDGVDDDGEACDCSCHEQQGDEDDGQA